MAQAANKDHNFFTKILNTRLKNAFYVERAAQSFFGSVLVASGMCSIYRSHIIKDNVEEWVSQTMFGIPQTFGDDRRLTAIEGFVSDAVEKGTSHMRNNCPRNYI